MLRFNKLWVFNFSERNRHSEISERQDEASTPKPDTDTISTTDLLGVSVTLGSVEGDLGLTPFGSNRTNLFRINVDDLTQYGLTYMPKEDESGYLIVPLGTSTVAGFRTSVSLSRFSWNKFK